MANNVPGSACPPAADYERMQQAQTSCKGMLFQSAPVSITLGCTGPTVRAICTSRWISSTLWVGGAGARCRLGFCGQAQATSTNKQSSA